MQTDVKWIGLLVVVVGGPAREELATRASHHDVVDGRGLTDGRALERGRRVVASRAHHSAHTAAATRTTPSAASATRTGSSAGPTMTAGRTAATAIVCASVAGPAAATSAARRD